MAIPSVFALTSAGLAISLAVSLLNVYKHLTHFHEPRFQLYIVRIILIVPVISSILFLKPLICKLIRSMQSKPT
mgnify:CR=1 FL=1